MIKHGMWMSLVLLALALAACSASPATSNTGGGGPAVAPGTPQATSTPPANIPIMPGATDIDISESAINFVIKSDLQNVIDFYEKELSARGWKEDEKPSVIATFGRMNFSKADLQLSMVLNASPALNQVVVRMTIIYLNVFQATPTP